VWRKSQEIRAVAIKDTQVREAGDEFRNVAARGLISTGTEIGVAVVFDKINDREPLQARDVERFPELAFAGGALAGVINVIASESGSKRRTAPAQPTPWRKLRAGGRRLR
jgi:hypothetical protein